MTIEEMKQTLEKCNKALALRGAFTKATRKKIKALQDRLEMRIWQAENPESFENHRAALQGYVDNTHIF